MKSKIILPIAISTLLLAFYASAQIPATPIEQQILPILKWIVAKTPEGWYGYLQDLVDSNNLVTNLKIEQNIKNGDDLYLSFRPLSLLPSPAFRYVLREGITGQDIRSVSVDELNNGSIKFTVPTLNIPEGKKYPFVYFVVYEEPNIVRESGTSTSLEKPEKRGNPLVVTPPLIYSYSGPYIKITSPEPGLVLKSGDVVPIKWESNLPKDKKLEILIRYTTEDKKRIFNIINSNVDNSGSYVWFIPELEDGNVINSRPASQTRNDELLKSKEATLEIRAEGIGPVTDGGGMIIGEVKNLSFATTSKSPYLNLIFPNGGNKIEIGNKYTITWQAKNLVYWGRPYRIGIALKARSGWYECEAKIADGLYPTITNFDWNVNIDNLKWYCDIGKGEYQKNSLFAILQNLVNRKLLPAQVLENFTQAPEKPTTEDRYWIYIYAYRISNGKYYLLASDRSDSPFNIVQPAPKPTIQILRKEANAPEPLLYGGTTTQLARFEFVNSGFQEDNPMNFNLQFVQYNYTYYYDEKYPIKSQMLKDVKVVVDGDINGYSTTSDWSINIPITIPAGRINGTHTVEFIATTRDYQDELYPYNYYHLILGFNDVVPQISDYKKSGSDSKRFKIHLPYYPSTNSSAKVGAEEYPAIVLYPDTSTKQVSVFFTSFTGRFDTIHVGLEGPNGQRKEIIKNCDGTCPRDINALIEKFGHPSEWGFLVLKWDFNKTIQYTGKLTMDRCVGTLNFDAKNLKPTIMICSNRMAFGNNYGWGRSMNLRINWNYIPYFAPGKEALNYLFILPRDIDQHFPPAPRKAY